MPIIALTGLSPILGAFAGLAYGVAQTYIGSRGACPGNDELWTYNADGPTGPALQQVICRPDFYPGGGQQMTKSHRNRLLLAAALVFMVIGIGVTPVAAASGAAAALGVFALTAIVPLALLGVMAYVWSRNDRDAASSARAQHTSEAATAASYSPRG